jgi:TolB-like protein
VSDTEFWLIFKEFLMHKTRFFLLMLLFVCVRLFAQNVSLDQAVQTSAQAIETRLPKGAKTAVLTFTATSQAFSNYIIDEIATSLSASRNIQVIDRQHTDAIRKEFNIQFSGDVSDDEVKRIGQQLGAQYVVTGSLVDIGNAYRFRVAAINIETAVREGSSSLNININDPQVVFLLTGQRVAPVDTTPTRKTYKTGDRGPGGGTIFFAQGGEYMEVSGSLGKATWEDAKKLAEDFTGGGFYDWHLPSRREAGLAGYFFDGWTSEAKNSRQAYYRQRSKDFAENKSDRWNVLAVRSFSE